MKKLFRKIWYPDEETRAMSYVPVTIMLLPILILSFFVPFWVVISLMFSFIAIGGIVRVRAAIIAELDIEDEEKMTRNKTFRKLARILVVVSGLLSLALYNFLPQGISFVAVFTAMSVSMIILGFAGYSIRTTMVLAFILAALVFVIGALESYRLGIIFTGMILVVGLPYCIERVVKTQRFLAGNTKQKTAPFDIVS